MCSLLGYGTEHQESPSLGKIVGVQAAGGIVAGATASCITTPLDTIKTRLQVQVITPSFPVLVYYYNYISGYFVVYLHVCMLNIHVSSVSRVLYGVLCTFNFSVIGLRRDCTEVRVYFVT